MSGAWCPTCSDWSVQETGRPCAWCDTIVIHRRGGWKRPDVTGRISETAARAIHAKYQTGISARTLGRELYQVLGYSTPECCGRQIVIAFKRWGLPTRDQRAATSLRHTKERARKQAAA